MVFLVKEQKVTVLVMSAYFIWASKKRSPVFFMIMFFLSGILKTVADSADSGILKTVAIRRLYGTVTGYMLYCNKKSTQF